MIPILFREDETNFESYGIGVMKDILSCVVTEELNGMYECIVTYPSCGELYDKLLKGSIVKLKANDTTKYQLFRIYKKEISINSICTYFCTHISYDLGFIPTLPFTQENLDVSLALNRIASNVITPCTFTFTTDLTENLTFGIDKPISVRAALGGDNGVLKIYGGEFEWDNYDVYLHENRGLDRGVQIEYGKNLIDLAVVEEKENVYSHIFPFARTKDGAFVTVEGNIVKVPNADITMLKTLSIDFSDAFEDDETITKDTLMEKVITYLQTTNLATPFKSLTLAFEPLADKYGFHPLFERVQLADIITVKHFELDVNIKVQVIKTEYDSLMEKFIKITLGEKTVTFIDDVKSLTDLATTTESKVKEVPDLVAEKVEEANNLITGQSGGYVVINSDETKKPYEILILDEPSIEDAVNVWRWNLGGLAFSKNGYNGPYEAAITSNGSIVADFINAGTLNANYLRAGVISSADGQNYWDLESGELVLGAMNSEMENIINGALDEFKKYSFRLGNFAFEPQINGSLSFNLAEGDI